MGVEPGAELFQWREPKPGQKAGFGKWKNPKSPYDLFIEAQGIPIHRDIGVHKVQDLPLQPWKRLGGRGTANEIIASAVLYDDKLYFGVGQDPEHGEGVGNLWCIDASLEGDVTEKGKVWHRGGNDFHRTISTVAIHDGIVYAADLSGFLYALDANTGQLYWKHDMLAAVWASPYVADGKVYLGDEDGDITVLKTGKTKEVLAEMNMGNAVYATPFAKDGVLYVLSRNRLFALQEGASSKP